MLTEKHVMPWYKRSYRGKRQVIDFLPVIEHLEWCRFCQMDVSPQIEQAEDHGLFVYRKNCLRCGQVMAYGMAKRDVNKPGPLDPRVTRFIQETTRDRR